MVDRVHSAKVLPHRAKAVPARFISAVILARRLNRRCGTKDQGGRKG
jgi:hypothetical protein